MHSGLFDKDLLWDLANTYYGQFMVTKSNDDLQSSIVGDG